jgi:F420-dependent oxidoreductase-like protein
MRAPFQLDLHVPNFNWPRVAPEDLFEHLAKIATTAEDSGFSAISMMDHYHQIPGVGPQTNYMFEGNTMLAALAARTSKASLGLLVGGVMYRNPAALAKITTGIDVISGGRAVLGLGAAWFEDEHKAYGFPFPPLKERFEHLEDALNIARKMFTEDPATYEGTHHSIHGAINNPRPLRGDIPILIGGSGEKKTLRMVAQYADASNVFGDVEKIKHLMGVLDAHCADVGRDPSEISRTKLATLLIGDTHEAAQAKADQLRAHMPAEMFDAVVLAGDRDGIAEQVAAHREAGLDGIIVNMPEVADLEQVQAAGEVLAAATR